MRDSTNIYRSKQVRKLPNSLLESVVLKKLSISKKFKRDNLLEYKPSQIVVSTGAKQSIANVCMVLLDPNDEVILPAPYWVSYSAISNLAEANPIVIPSSIESDFKITAEQLENKITSKTKLVIIKESLGIGIFKAGSPNKWKY